MRHQRFTIKDIKADLARLFAHLDKQYSVENPEEETKKTEYPFNVDYHPIA